MLFANYDTAAWWNFYIVGILQIVYVHIAPMWSTDICKDTKIALLIFAFIALSFRFIVNAIKSYLLVLKKF